MATVLNHDDDPPLVDRIDRVLTELCAGEKAWAETPLAGRARMLSAVHRLTVAHAADWVDAAVAIKGLDPSSPLVGEEWISGPWVMATNAATLAHSVAELAHGRSPRVLPGSGPRRADARPCRCCRPAPGTACC